MTIKMNKKHMYIESIKNYYFYTNKQRSILTTLVEVSIDNVATISPLDLSEISNATLPVVYTALRLFEEENIIEIQTKNNKIGVFKISKENLDKIEKRYKKIKKLKNKF